MFVHPQVLSVSPGGGAAIACQAIGIPQPMVRWVINRRDDLPSGAEQRGPVLYLSSVTQDLAQMYTCVAENQHGTASANAIVQVKCMFSCVLYTFLSNVCF